MSTALAVGASVIALAFTAACSRESRDAERSGGIVVEFATVVRTDRKTARRPGDRIAAHPGRLPRRQWHVHRRRQAQVGPGKTGKSKPEKVDPPGCYEFISEGDGDYDRARAKYDADTVMAESSVGLGIKQSFDELAQRAQECASVQMEGDGVAMKAKVSIADLPGPQWRPNWSRSAVFSGPTATR